MGGFEISFEDRGDARERFVEKLLIALSLAVRGIGEMYRVQEDLRVVVESSRVEGRGKRKERTSVELSRRLGCW